MLTYIISYKQEIKQYDKIIRIWNSVNIWHIIFITFCLYHKWLKNILKSFILQHRFNILILLKSCGEAIIIIIIIIILFKKNFFFMPSAPSFPRAKNLC